MPFDDAITARADLRALYAEPHPIVLKKVIGRVDDGARTFIEAAPFVVVATHGPNGLDASPRGGPLGFVRVLDEGRLAFGDLSGNRRLDSFENVLHDSGIGLIFLVPGVAETLRVNGQATLTVDPAVLAACTVDGKRPKVALGIDVAECYIHCGKALLRSQLWDDATWLAASDQPSPAGIVREHIEVEASAELIQQDLEADYRATMWEPGGNDG